MTETGKRKILRFALMCRETGMQEWQARAVERLLSEGIAEPVLVIVPAQNPEEKKTSFTSKLASYPWKKILFKKYYQYFFKPEDFRITNHPQGLEKVPVLRCRTSRKGKYSEYFSNEDLESIRSYTPDFILKFAFGIIRGPVLTAAPYGVWSFHHGDELKYRGVPPAFREILHHDPVTASILQRLTETLDGGIVLRKGHFPTIGHSWKANLTQAIRLSENWPADVCREIALQHTFPSQAEPATPMTGIYTEPENTTMLQFLLQLLANKLKFHFRDLIEAEKWTTGVLRARTAEIIGNIDFSIDPDAVDWIGAEGKNRYFADGFALRDDQQLLLLFEDYSYQRGKGIISACRYSVRDGVAGEINCALEEPWHLSYPFIFVHENETYCIPEAKDHGSIELYRLDKPEMKLKHVRTLIRGVAAADPTLVMHNNDFYLFFTPAHATNVELHIWHSETLEGPYVPHQLNPVKADVANARPAGPFFRLDNKLYRPAQDCSHTYGGRVIINEVNILTGNAFLETPVGMVEPPAGFSGLHTISFAGDFLYFDSKKMVFSPAGFLQRLLQKIGRTKRNDQTKGV